MVKIRQRFIAGRPVSKEEAGRTPLHSGHAARLVDEVRRRAEERS